MTDKSSESAHREGGAAKRPEVGHNESSQDKQTGAGREATTNAPKDHPTEHQSGYGGGGPNGGADTR